VTGERPYATLGEISSTGIGQGMHVAENMRAWMADKKNIAALIRGVTGAAPEGIFRLLEVGDAPFRGAAKKMILDEMADIQGLAGVARKKWLAKQALKPDADTEQAFLQLVLQDDNMLQSLLTKGANWAYAGISEKYGPGAAEAAAWAGSVILPYMKTPFNVAAMAFDYMMPTASSAFGTHLLVAGKRAQRQARSDLASATTPSARAAAKAAVARATAKIRNGETKIGRAVTGYMLSTLGLVLAQAGVVTPGLGDRDDKEDKMRRGLGGLARFNWSGMRRLLRGESAQWQEGDLTMSCLYMGLHGLIFTAAANHTRQVRKSGKSFENVFVTPLTTAMGGQMSKIVFDLANMKGMFTVLEGIQEGRFSRVMENMTTALFAAVKPRTVDMLQGLGDQYIRDARAAEDNPFKRALWKTLSWDKEYNPIQDVLGRPVKRTPAGRSYLGYHGVDSFHFSRVPDDPHMLTIYRTWLASGKDQDVLPSAPSSVNGHKLEGDDLYTFRKMVGNSRMDYYQRFGLAKSQNPDRMKRANDLGRERGTLQFLRQHPDYRKKKK